DLLQQVRATALGAYAHQDVPFEQLVEALKPERHLSHSPLFQVMLALQNAPMDSLELPELTLEPVAADTTTAKFDLTLSLTEQDGHLDAVFEYNTDLFDRATIERMAGHFTQLLAAVAAHPDSRIADLPMLGAAERDQLLFGFNSMRAAHAREQLLQAVFADSAEEAAQAILRAGKDSKLDFYILDTHGNPAPVGIAGELHVGGEALDGIDTGQAAQRWMADPFRSGRDARLYRTGALARHLPDGRIVHLGAIDEQVELRGFRIALGDIEAALAAQAEVRDAAVLAREAAGSVADAGGQRERRLVAYVVPHDRDVAVEAATQALRSALLQALPDYMVPAHFVFLDAIPRTAAGKPDREALPAPQADDSETGHVAPRSAVEKALAAIWSEVLSREQIGIHDNFFTLGGHSLLVAVVVSQIEVQLAVSIPIEVFFTSQTIAELARYIEDNRQAQGDGSQEQSLLVSLQPSGDGLPLYCIHPVGGHVFCYRELALQLGNGFPVYGLQSPEAAGIGPEYATINAMAAAYAEAIRAKQPDGPYRLLGWSSGGLIALEVARALETQGCEVEYIGLLDSQPIAKLDGYAQEQLLMNAALVLLAGIRGSNITPDELASMGEFLRQNNMRFSDLIKDENQALALPYLTRWIGSSLTPESFNYLKHQLDITRRHLDLLAGFVPEPVKAPLHICRAQGSLQRTAAFSFAGAEGVPARGTTEIVDGDHYTMLSGLNARGLGRAVERNLHLNSKETLDKIA
ncbi:MAG TPA: condensation domain-containing protein, partial [Paucimonas sp.]|nr:condensation domain-containing protein [Paucimonas sp.]